LAGSNGPIEAMNLLFKKIKRVGHGFRNFNNYRLRLLLHCGVDWPTHQTTPLEPDYHLWLRRARLRRLLNGYMTGRLGHGPRDDCPA